MAGLFSRKQKATLPTSQEELMHHFIDQTLLHHQKIAETKEGLREIVIKADLTKENFSTLGRIRKNAISELLVDDIEAMQNELEALKQISKAIKGNRYEELLRQASEQKKYDLNYADRTQTVMLGNEKIGSPRHTAVGKIQQAGRDYKKLAREYNKRVDNVKTLSANSNNKLIESERAHVAGLISEFTAYLAELKNIKKQMDSNPNFEQVVQAKKDIQIMLNNYDSSEESAKLDELRTENASIENNLNDLFNESGAIKELEKQLDAKKSEINHLFQFELHPNDNLLVL